MKSPLVISILSAIASVPLVTFGQNPSPAPSSPPEATPAAAETPHHAGMLDSLSPEDRQAFMAAAKKARQDPKVMAAAAKMRDARDALDDAMLAKDKSLAPIIDKIKASDTPGSGHLQLSSDEMQQLHDAQKGMKGTPELIAWREATATYRDAMRQAMTAADPSVAAILAKLPQHGPGPGAAAGAAPSASPSATGT